MKYLRVNDEYNRSNTREYFARVVCGVKIVYLSGIVVDVELDEGVLINLLLLDFYGGFQEKSLIWRHFMKDYLLNGGLATSAQAQEEQFGLHFKNVLSIMVRSLDRSWMRL